MLYQLSYGHILQNTKELNLTSDNINTFGVLTLTYTKYLFSQLRNNISKLLRTNNFKYLTPPRIWPLCKIIKTTVYYCLGSKIRTCARHYSMLAIPNHARLTGLLHTQLIIAEGVGFEPTGPFGHTRFQV